MYYYLYKTITFYQFTYYIKTLNLTLYILLNSNFKEIKMPTYKNKEKNTFYCSFYYTDWTGKKCRKKKEGFKRERDAKQFEIDFLNKIKNNCDMPFNTLVNLYLEDISTKVRSTTFANKKHLIELKIIPYFENLIITEITPNHVREWQNNLKKNEYSQTYLKSINNQLSAIFNFAIRYYGLHSNPALRAGSMGKKNADSMDFWTLDEFKRFLKYDDKIISKIAFKILFWTGMRRGELLALTYNDIDTVNKTININKTYTKLNGKDVVNPPKTPKSKRVISIPDHLAHEIETFKDALYDYNENDRVFDFGLPYLLREMKRICKESGVKKIRIHDLRHSHASLLIELGFSPILISERLGHEKIQTTLDIYSHLYPNKDSLVSKKLNDLY